MSHPPTSKVQLYHCWSVISYYHRTWTLLDTWRESDNRNRPGGVGYVMRFWFCLHAVRFSSQTNADLLTLAVSMVKCKSVPLQSASVLVRDHNESWFCLFSTAAPKRHSGVMSLKEPRQNQDLHPNGALCESHIFYYLTVFWPKENDISVNYQVESQEEPDSSSLGCCSFICWAHLWCGDSYFESLRNFFSLRLRFHSFLSSTWLSAPFHPRRWMTLQGFHSCCSCRLNSSRHQQVTTARRNCAQRPSPRPRGRLWFLLCWCWRGMLLLSQVKWFQFSPSSFASRLPRVRLSWLSRRLPETCAGELDAVWVNIMSPDLRTFLSRCVSALGVFSLPVWFCFTSFLMSVSLFWHERPNWGIKRNPSVVPVGASSVWWHHHRSDVVFQMSICLQVKPQVTCSGGFVGTNPAWPLTSWLGTMPRVTKILRDSCVYIKCLLLLLCSFRPVLVLILVLLLFSRLSVSLFDDITQAVKRADTWILLHCRIHVVTFCRLSLTPVQRLWVFERTWALCCSRSVLVQSSCAADSPASCWCGGHTRSEPRRRPHVLPEPIGRRRHGWEERSAGASSQRTSSRGTELCNSGTMKPSGPQFVYLM